MAKQRRSEKKDAYTIVLEHIHSDFRVFGENLELVRDQTSHRFDKVDARLDGVDERLDKVDKRLERVDTQLNKVDERLNNIETELALIRHNQVTRDEFKFLEARVVRLERKLK